jgi:hypothetical protein
MEDCTVRLTLNWAEPVCAWQSPGANRKTQQPSSRPFHTIKFQLFIFMVNNASSRNYNTENALGIPWGGRNQLGKN